MFKKLFGTKEKTYTQQEYDDRADNAYEEGFEKAKKMYDVKKTDGESANTSEYTKGHEEGYAKGYSDAKTKFAPGTTKTPVSENQKLTFTERRQVKKLRAKLLDNMEDILEKTTMGVRGAAI